MADIAPANPMDNCTVEFDKAVDTRALTETVDWMTRQDRLEWARCSLDNAEWLVAYLRAGAPQFLVQEAKARYARMIVFDPCGRDDLCG